ncbi:hypothetical protein CBL_01810 [Carabus blaptoides fortunei]
MSCTQSALMCTVPKFIAVLPYSCFLIPRFVRPAAVVEREMLRIHVSTFHLCNVHSVHLLLHPQKTFGCMCKTREKRAMMHRERQREYIGCLFSLVYLARPNLYIMTVSSYW